MGGKLRPLGIPTIADKLLQRAVAKLLEAIYEQDFLSCSYGYRRGTGALKAIKDLTGELNSKKYHAVVEADIKGFSNAINHDLLLEMLLMRIDDKPLMNLVCKWLKAGILETDGRVLHPVAGAPQGGSVLQYWPISISILCWTCGLRKQYGRTAMGMFIYVAMQMILSVCSKVPRMQGAFTKR